MNKRDAKKFQKLLLAERDRLMHGLKRLEEDSLGTSGDGRVSDVSSFAEVGTDNFEREKSLNIVSGESEWLTDIEDALVKIEKGGYGICEDCGKAIPKKRLEAFPSARRCVECQAELEQYGATGSGY